MPGLPPPRHIPTLPSNLATSAHSGLTTIEAVEDGWCRRCISHAMASGSQTVRLRRARAARSAETGFAPGHGGFTGAHRSAFHPCAGTGWIADASHRIPTQSCSLGNVETFACNLDDGKPPSLE